MAGFIDLRSGAHSITGTNNFKVDKSPLDQINQGIEDVIGKQALSAGNQFANALQALIDAIIGERFEAFDPFDLLNGREPLVELTKYFGNLVEFLGLPDFLDAAFDIASAAFKFANDILLPTGLFALIQDIVDEIWKAVQAIIGFGDGTWPDLEKYFGNLVGFLGLPNFNLANFDIPAAAIEFVTKILLPTNLFAVFQDITDEIQKVIDAILGILGGTLAQLTQFFSNLLKFLGLPDFLDGAFDVLAAAAEFIKNILNPTGLLTTIQDIIDEIWKAVQAILGFGDGTWAELERYFGNLLKFLGLPDFNLANFDVLAAATAFINNVLNPTGLLTTVQKIIDEIAKAVNAILGLGDGTWPDLERYFGNLVGFLGLPDFNLANFNIPAAAAAFITNILNPTGLLTSIAQATAVAVAEVQKLINAILGGTNLSFTDVTKYFTNLLAMFANPSFLSDTFNAGTAVSTFIANMINPLNVLAPLDVNLKVPDVNAPQAVGDMIGYIKSAFEDLGNAPLTGGIADSVLGDMFGIFDVALNSHSSATAINSNVIELTKRVFALESNPTAPPPPNLATLSEGFDGGRGDMSTTTYNIITTPTGRGDLGRDGKGNGVWLDDVIPSAFGATGIAVHRSALGTKGTFQIVLATGIANADVQQCSIWGIVRSNLAGTEQVRLRLQYNNLEIQVYNNGATTVLGNVGISTASGDRFQLTFGESGDYDFVVTKNVSANPILTVTDTGQLSFIDAAHSYVGYGMTAGVKNGFLGINDQAKPGGINLWSATGET